MRRTRSPRSPRARSTSALEVPTRSVGTVPGDDASGMGVGSTGSMGAAVCVGGWVTVPVGAWLRVVPDADGDRDPAADETVRPSTRRPTPIPDASSPGTVPKDLVGTSSADVERALGDLGLRVRRIAVRSSAPDGQVLATVPRAGAATAPGQSVLVVASAGRDHGRDGGDGWVVPRWLVGAKADRLSRGLRGRGITPVAVPVASDQPRARVRRIRPGDAVRSGQLVLATSTGKPAAERAWPAPDEEAVVPPHPRPTWKHSRRSVPVVG